MPQYYSGACVLTPGDSRQRWERSTVSPGRSKQRPVSATRARPRCPCRVGSVFVLGKETDGQFRCVSSLTGRHILFLAGGFDRLLVALGYPDCPDNSAADASDSETDRHAFSGHPESYSVSGTSCHHVEARKSLRRASDSPRETPGSRAATEVLAAGSQVRGCTSAATRAGGRGGSGTPPRCRLRARKGSGVAPDSQIMHARSRLQHVLCRRDSEHKTPSPDSRFTDLFSPSGAAALASETIRWISPGAKHLLILTDSEKLYSCGENLFGCTGQGGTAGRDVPQLVPALNEASVSCACAGGTFSLALTSGGGVYTWGGAFLGQSGRGPEEVSLVPRFLQTLMRTPISHLACNESHVLAITRDGGQCLAWGSNDCGQLGIGRRCSVQYEPRLVVLRGAPQPNICDSSANSFCDASRREHADTAPGSETVHTETGGKGSFTGCVRDSEPAVVVQVAAGWRHSLALTIHGEVFAWGFNACGQLGLGHRDLAEVPTLVCDYERQLRSPRSYCPSPTRFSSTGTPLSLSRSLVPTSFSTEKPREPAEGAAQIGTANLPVKEEGWTRPTSSSTSRGPFSCAIGAMAQCPQNSSELGCAPLTENRASLQGLQLGGYACERDHLVTVKQICAGKLFSGFLAEDGRVFVSGRLPSGRDEAIRKKLTKKEEQVSEQDRQAIQANLVPSKLCADTTSRVLHEQALGRGHVVSRGLRYTSSCPVQILWRERRIEKLMRWLVSPCPDGVCCALDLDCFFSQLWCRAWATFVRLRLPAATRRWWYSFPVKSSTSNRVWSLYQCQMRLCPRYGCGCQPSLGLS